VADRKPLRYDTALQWVRGVGERRQRDLRRDGIERVEDLLYHLPFRYEDRARFVAIRDLRPAERVTLQGRVLGSRLIRTRRRGFTIFEATVDDGTAAVQAVWFNQPYLTKLLGEGVRVILYGEPSFGRQGAAALRLENPEYEVVAAEVEPGDDATLHTGRVVPVYRKVGGQSSRRLRRIVHNALQDLSRSLPDPLPRAVREAHDLLPRREAFARVHFPKPDEPIAPYENGTSAAHRRLAFEELFFLQLGLALRREGVHREPRGTAFETSPEIREKLLEVLPFRLTRGQRDALREIVDDLRSAHPMYRLLQGDVGCGKTIVALLAALIVIENGYQAALMAPTEVLAEQHALGLRRLLAGTPHRLELFTGGGRAAARRAREEDLAAGRIHLAVGTHALIQEGIRFQRLGLAIVDEQHRFGVVQRQALGQKGRSPDVLVMTATPIPRSLALTVYGDLDVSSIREMPPGRQPIRTHVRYPDSRRKILTFLRDEVRAGRQAYVVYPLVEETARSDLKAATEGAERIAGDLPEVRVGLIHGRMKGPDKEAVMTAFAAGEVQLLVSTTVIEVGIDVPNASVILIENAERFGLSQLHQLRGRVGRGPHASHCILLSGRRDLNDEARARLEAMASTQDGFRIAEEDLRLRGPGDFFGTRQWGLPPLRVANLLRDHELLLAAREEARGHAADVAAGRPGADRLLAQVRAYWGPRLGTASVG
jgi:ATP-dependent DNA helicase RecG